MSAPPRPVPVLVTCGVPASGKSTLARALSSSLGLPVVTTRMARGQHPKNLATRDPARYSKAVYTQLGRLTAEQAERSGGVIVDGTFRRASDRPLFINALGPHRDGAVFVQCWATPSILQTRRRQRIRRHRPSDPDMHSFDPLDDVDGCPVLCLQTGQSVPVLVATVRGFLSRSAAG